MTYMTEAKGLRKQFGDDTAVDDATFNINPSDVVGFLGPNGAGKTTTIKMITGLPDRMRVSRPTSSSPVRKQMMSYLPPLVRYTGLTRLWLLIARVATPWGSMPKPANIPTFPGWAG